MAGAREFGVAKSKARHGLVPALVLLVLGGWVLLFGGDSIPDRIWVGMLALGLGSGFAIHAWWTARRAVVQLRLDEFGIWFNDWGVTVPWGEVGDVYQTGHRLQPFLSVHLNDPARFIASLSESEVRKLRGNRLWKVPELRIPNGAVDVSQHELLDLLRSGWKENSASGEAVDSGETGS